MHAVKVKWSSLHVLLILTFILNISHGFLIKSSETGINAVRKAPRVNIPWLWIGVQCNGCPPTGCEDDVAMIHGYCCGCAYALDKLPIICSGFLRCPLNLHGVCHDYEYMMRCCC